MQPVCNQSGGTDKARREASFARTIIKCELKREMLNYTSQLTQLWGLCPTYQTDFQLMNSLSNTADEYFNWGKTFLIT